MKYGFVVLHYLAIEETIDCVNSILSLDCDGEKIIVVVDNASPNNSGITIKDHFRNYTNVYVIFTSENLGYARGNNYGFSFCKKFDCDFIIVPNNDVVFFQNDILSRINNEYQNSHFSVLGPDIYNPRKSIHQNPLRITGLTTNDIYFDIRKRKSILLFLHLEKIFPHIVNFIKKTRKKKNIQSNSVGYTDRAIGCVLYGACLIFSKEYFLNRKDLFYSGTFLYFEEDFLFFNVTRLGGKMIYEPSLKVFHKENASTDMISKSDIDIRIKKAKYSLESETKLYSFQNNKEIFQ